MALLLIIDEDRDSGHLIGRILTRRGHKAAIFENIEDAITWLETNTPDLILLSAGKYGEKAGLQLKSLCRIGIQSANIVLGAEEGTLTDVRKAYGRQVREVLIKTSDFEKLEHLISAKDA